MLALNISIGAVLRVPIPRISMPLVIAILNLKNFTNNRNTED